MHCSELARRREAFLDLYISRSLDAKPENGSTLILGCGSLSGERGESDQCVSRDFLIMFP